MSAAIMCVDFKGSVHQPAVTNNAALLPFNKEVLESGLVAIKRVLYDDYAPILIISVVVLLVALIGAAALSRKGLRGGKKNV